MLKRPRRPADGPPVDGPERDRKPAKKRTAGVKASLPVVALAGLEGLDAAADPDGEGGLAADIMELDDTDEDDDDDHADEEVCLLGRWAGWQMAGCMGQRAGAGWGEGGFHVCESEG